MGPYYRDTSQGMGAFFELFYEQPLLMLLLILGVAGMGFYIWWRKRA